ncbi:MAG: PAS domain-containing protein [Nanoarchaeota archaeon]|nr:PAS domain-containing protein [Nanoarchaeota archaeon]MCG2717416.1 PAS domain-containing protein [Nanoarchaeota archaeon]
MQDKLLKKGKKFFKEIDFIVDLDGFSFAWVNEKAAKKLGYTAKEMVKLRLQDLLDFGSIFNQMKLNKTMHQEKGKITWTAIKKDGSKVTLNTRFHNIKDDDGTYHFTKIVKMEKERY